MRAPFASTSSTARMDQDLRHRRSAFAWRTTWIRPQRRKRSWTRWWTKPTRSGQTAAHAHGANRRQTGDRAVHRLDRARLPFLDDEALDLMKARGTVWIPT